MPEKPSYEELATENAQLKSDLLQCKHEKEVLSDQSVRYYNLYDSAPFALMEFDFSRFKETLKKEKIKDGEDFNVYLQKHPEFLEKAEQLIIITDVNEATLLILRAKDKVELVGPMSRIFSSVESARQAYRESLIAVAGGTPYLELKTIARMLDGEERHVMLKMAFSRERKNSDMVLAGLIDITEMKQMEEQLRKAHDELEMRVDARTAELRDANKRLEEFNVALKVLLQNRENDKKELEEKILLNLKNLVFPYVDKLKTGGRSADQVTYLEILESNLRDMISPFSLNLSSQYVGLTPKEIQVAALIKDGKTTKEIADLLPAGERTIDFHRKNIRKKLGLRNQRVNLTSYLQFIS